MTKKDLLWGRLVDNWRWSFIRGWFGNVYFGRCKLEINCDIENNVKISLVFGKKYNMDIVLFISFFCTIWKKKNYLILILNKKIIDF